MRCRILSMRAGINGLTSEDVIYLEISLMLESVFSIIELLVSLNNDLSRRILKHPEKILDLRGL